MDNNLKSRVTNTLIDGLIFLEKIINHLTPDLKLERSTISQSFKNVLFVLDQPEHLYANSESQSSVENEAKNISREGTNENKHREEIGKLLVLKKDRNFFKMHSDISPDRCIRLFLSISDQLKGFYFCVLERSNVLLGLELNGSPPDYVISLEIFDIKRDKGPSIKLKNNGLDIVMQFDNENTCNYWLTSFLNAQTSVYSYIPVPNLYQKDTQDSYSVLKVPPIPGKLSTSIIPTKCSYDDLLHHFDFTEITETQNFKSTRKMSRSTDSVFIDAPSINNFEGLKIQYTKKINKSTDELNGTNKKVIQKTKSRTLPNSSKKGNIMVRKGPFPEIRIEDDVTKLSHPQMEITDSENKTSKMKSKTLPKNKFQNIKSFPPTLKKVENVILNRYKMKQFERDKLVVFLNFN